MTKSETISNLKAYLDGDTAIGNIIPLRSVLESAIKYLEPSLPSNLDEAAEIYYEQDCPYPGEVRVINNEHDVWFPSSAIEDAFKAGAEWMAGQGETLEVEVKEDAGGYPYIPSIELYDYDKDEPLSKPGDKVVVQIRKK